MPKFAIWTPNRNWKYVYFGEVKATSAQEAQEIVAKLHNANKRKESTKIQPREVRAWEKV